MTNLPSYLTAIVAVMVAWIARQQYLLARENFMLDLFEKRFGVYKAAQKFLSCIMRNPNNIDPKDASE